MSEILSIHSGSKIWSTLLFLLLYCIFSGQDQRSCHWHTDTALFSFKICTEQRIDIAIFKRPDKNQYPVFLHFSSYRTALQLHLHFHCYSWTCVFTGLELRMLHTPTHQGNSFIILLIHASSTWYELSNICKHSHSSLYLHLAQGIQLNTWKNEKAKTFWYFVPSVKNIHDFDFVSWVCKKDSQHLIRVQCMFTEHVSLFIFTNKIIHILIYLYYLDDLTSVSNIRQMGQMPYWLARTVVGKVVRIPLHLLKLRTKESVTK